MTSGREFKSHRAKLPNFEPGKSFYDLGTFSGRLKHFLRVLDPRTLFISAQYLKRCENMVKDWQVGSYLKNQELWDCQSTLEACTHPLSKSTIPTPFRMAAFVPINVPIVFIMMQATSPGGVLFVHWLNQTYNSAVNFSNRSSGGAADTNQVLQSYLLAVATSCSLALGLGKLARKIPAASPALFSYIAVSAAGTSNIIFSRQNELREGASISDSSGQYYGRSLIAGKNVVIQTAISCGVIFPLPVLILPHLIMRGLAKLTLLPTSPRLRLAVELTAITGSLAGALPVCMALFPQTASYKATDLEPKFHNLRDVQGRPILIFYAKKGL